MDKTDASFLRGGNYHYGSGNLNVRGSNGYDWESEFNDASSARYLLFYSTDLIPQGYRNKGFGFSVRCVAR